MKRIIDGKACNTRTAQKIAHADFKNYRFDGVWHNEWALYRTKGGDFFVVNVDTARKDAEHKIVNFARVSYDQAYRFVQDAKIELLVDDIFPSKGA